MAGVIARKERHRGRLVQRHKILGLPEEVPDILSRLEVEGTFVDRIVVTVPASQLRQIEREALQSVEAASNIRVEFLSEALGFSQQTPISDSRKFIEIGEVAFAFPPHDLQRLAQRALLDNEARP